MEWAMPEMYCAVIYVLIAILVGLHLSFRDEVEDLWQDIFGTRISSTPEKDRFEFRSWWHDELSEDERDSYLKVVQDPLGTDPDLHNPGDEEPETLDPEK